MVRKMLKESNFKYRPGGNDNMTVMVHDFGDGFTNTLVCSVASTGALGYPFDWLLLDEFEFWENPEGLEYMYDQILEPRTFNTRGQIIIYSNPNGRNYVSENLHKRKINEEYQFHVYNINFLDNPSNTREEWDVKSEHTHPIIFASTMAAERTESEGAALTMRDIEKITSNKDLTDNGMHGLVDKPCHFFLDLGFIHDQSVLVGGWREYPLDENKKPIEGAKPKYKFVYKTYPQAYEIPAIWGKISGPEPSVPSIIKSYGNVDSMFDLDITGKEGNEVLANEAGLGCTGTKMSGPWKAKWYERFISLSKQGRLQIGVSDNYIDGKNKDFVHQARSLRISTKMQNGNTRPYPLYHHTNEKDHDDILDAVVGCLSMLDDDMNPDGGMFFVPGEKTSDKLNKDKLLKEIPEGSDIAGYDDGTIASDNTFNNFYGGDTFW
jgi:hypothetical protein